MARHTSGTGHLRHELLQHRRAVVHEVAHDDVVLGVRYSDRCVRRPRRASRCSILIAYVGNAGVSPALACGGGTPPSQRRSQTTEMAVPVPRRPDAGAPHHGNSPGVPLTARGGCRSTVHAYGGDSWGNEAGAKTTFLMAPPPTVTATAIAQRGAFTVSATATSTAVKINRIEFYENNLLLGTRACGNVSLTCSASADSGDPRPDPQGEGQRLRPGRAAHRQVDQHAAAAPTRDQRHRQDWPGALSDHEGDHEQRERGSET